MVIKLRYQKHPVCLIFALLLVFVLSGCASEENVVISKETGKKEFAALVQLSDMNEMAFEYHQHCLRKAEPMNDMFLENFETVSNLLFDKALETKGWSPEYIVSQVLKRRADIQHTLNRHYYTEGCQSEEAMVSRDHYRAFSHSAYKGS